MDRDRRGFLAGSGTLFLAASGYLAWRRFLAAPDSRAFKSQRAALLASFSRADVPPELVEWGRRYLGSHPEEGSIDRMAALLSGVRTERAPVSIAATWMDADTHVQSDLSAGRMIALDGWYLTRSEARLCAIAYLAKESAN